MASVKSIGFDGLLNYYAGRNVVCDTEMEKAFREHMDWNPILGFPYVSIADEELIDTVRPGIFTNDELVRIYYGTLRLGVNMHKTTPGWLTARNDTLFARIPRIELLDNNFIDEGLTKSFYESGTWTDKDRADLYDRAYQQMKKRCLTPANIKTAEASCTTQFTKIFKALGYEKVSITYDK